MSSQERKAVPAEVFELLVEQVKEYAIVMLDPEGYVLTWNEGARRIKGYEASEIIGKHFSQFYSAPEVIGQKPQTELRIALEKGRYEEEGWRIRKDGSRFWANEVIDPILNRQGQLIGFAKVTRDLTQRMDHKESLQRLFDSEERFRLLVEQVRDYAIFILDAQGHVATWNQGAKRIKGYSSEEIIGKHFSTFYTPEDIAKNHPANELAIATREGRYEDEGWRVKKDGSRFWANVVITSLWDKEGILTGFAKVTRDLTKRKMEEEALRHRTEELEAFAHTLAHDLRAPLRSISRYSEILKTEGQDLTEAEKEHYLERTIRAAQSMEHLIEEILRYSQLSLAPAPEESVPLMAVLEESVRLLESDIQRTEAQIEIRQPLPTIQGNRTMLLQIFSNLLSNALKFVAVGQRPKVVVYVVTSQGHCIIHVKDSGIGIPEEHQQTIFKMFERGTATGRFNGTGIGLAIVKKAAERMGGTVLVQSREGEGSEFVVTLPCSSVACTGIAGKV